MYISTQPLTWQHGIKSLAHRRQVDGSTSRGHRNNLLLPEDNLMQRSAISNFIVMAEIRNPIAAVKNRKKVKRKFIHMLIDRCFNKCIIQFQLHSLDISKLPSG